MTEDFLSRWARLKRESAAQPSAQPAPGSDPAIPTTDSAPLPLEPGAAPAIDLAKLPGIESISAESSVAVFLQAGVPEDVTRAALRSAWVTDPTIRDFVGIAENQWDFNAEGAIAGFSSLGVEEYARYVAARALGAQRGVAAALESDQPGQESPDASASNPSGDRTEARSTTVQALPSPPVAQESIGQPQIATASSESASPSSSPAPTKRTHGSALPK